MIDPVLKRALKTWGEQAQMMMVVEEMSELMKEILKNICRHKDNIDQIIEETADVEIMLAQLKENYQIFDRVETYKTEKIKLIAKRLDDWDKK
ncbi:MAG: hypothetical protein E7020_06175 [Alphaproteobacteria bacterium]|nr:hypothetical protein [Alphaproteobacteria bacterium]